jgi:hypothetical protein
MRFTPILRVFKPAAVPSPTAAPAAKPTYVVPPFPPAGASSSRCRLRRTKTAAEKGAATKSTASGSSIIEYETVESSVVSSLSSYYLPHDTNNHKVGLA